MLVIILVSNVFVDRQSYKSVCEHVHPLCTRSLQSYFSEKTMFCFQVNSDFTYGAIQKVFHRKNPNFWPPSPPCHRLSPFALTPLPPCHHLNSDKLLDPKLAEKSLGLCLTEHIRMQKSHIEWQQKSRIKKKTMFHVFKTSETVVSKSEKFQIPVY